MTGSIDKDGFCTDCQQPADWCECLPEPEADGEPGADIGADGESPLAALKAEVAKAAKDDKPAAAVRVLEQMIQDGMAAADRASVRKWIISQRLITAAEFDRITRRRTPAAEAGAIDADPAPGEPLTELGYARRLIHVYGDRLRYVPAWRRWLVWDGKRWAHDATGQAARWMKSIARRITADALADRGCRNASTIRNSLPGRVRARHRRGAHPGGHRTGHRGQPTTCSTPTRSCSTRANGTLDLRTGELTPHDPADLLTKMTAGRYQPGRPGPELDQVPGHASSRTRRCAATWPGCSATRSKAG